MISHFGSHLKLSIFGASHAPQIGMELDGIPAGLSINLDALQHFLDRRAPGRSPWSTSRKEADIPEFQSGLDANVTNGDPIRAVIQNQNIRKADYDALRHIPRPGHADFTAWKKYGLDYDMSGGGPFSGRMTAPLCIAGGLCKQWLEQRGIRIGAHIAQIGAVKDASFHPLHPELDKIDPDFPTLTQESGESMQQMILSVKAEGDSIGGAVECAVVGLSAGLGAPMFGGIESRIAQIVYGIPAVKAVEFGQGCDYAFTRGSQSNDGYYLEGGRVQTLTNHCGGILGGITSGMPLIFRATFKPTPSIALPQRSVNLETMEEVTITVNGRHDPCIVPRAVAVVEAAAAIAIFDLILGESL